MKDLGPLHAHDLYAVPHDAVCCYLMMYVEHHNVCWTSCCMMYLTVDLEPLNACGRSCWIWSLISQVVLHNETVPIQSYTPHINRLAYMITNIFH